MNIKIGEKIKQLRLRDGRRQEDLAASLGISPQAVSRWESGVGYPDMELVPAIANYFHVSIDSLFGYQYEREEKIKEIIEKAQLMLAKEGHVMGKGYLSDGVEECVKYLRAVAEEFPTEPRILMKLGQALQTLGWHKYGTKGTYDDELSAFVEDIAYNAQNECWQEAVRIYERILLLDVSQEYRNNVIYQIVTLYGRMGEYEKAKELANKQNPLYVCKEVLLPQATNGEEGARYRGEEIIALMKKFKVAINCAIGVNPSVFKSEYGRHVLLSLLELEEMIFYDGRCGTEHLNFGRQWMQLASYEWESGDKDVAFEYFDRALKHVEAYNDTLDEKEYCFTAPLLSKVKEIRDVSLPKIGEDFWRHELKSCPKAFLAELKKSSKYASCFK